MNPHTAGEESTTVAQDQEKDPYEELAGRAERGELIPDGSRALYGDAARESARKILFAAAGVSRWEEFERQELTDHTD